MIRTCFHRLDPAQKKECLEAAPLTYIEHHPETLNSGKLKKVIGGLFKKEGTRRPLIEMITHKRNNKLASTILEAKEKNHRVAPELIARSEQLIAELS